MTLIGFCVPCSADVEISARGICVEHPLGIVIPPTSGHKEQRLIGGIWSPAKRTPTTAKRHDFPADPTIVAAPTTVPLSEQRRVCRGCGGEFTPAAGNQVRCAASCRARTQMGFTRSALDLPERVCTICGATFQPSSANQGRCSLPCRRTYELAQGRAYYARTATPRVAPPLPPRTCAVCAVDFTPTRGAQVCCSPACQSQRDYAARLATETVPCVICSREFTPRRRAHGYEQRACSIPCARKLAGQVRIARRQPVACLECRRTEQTPFTRGLCHRCYQRQRRAVAS